MSAAHTLGPLTIAQTVAGYTIYRADNWPIGHAVQRDDHPVKGGGITETEAKANALLFAMSPALFALARRYASECAECGGVGKSRISHHDRPDEIEVCDACSFIWAVIDLAEGRS